MLLINQIYVAQLSITLVFIKEGDVIFACDNITNKYLGQALKRPPGRAL